MAQDPGASIAPLFALFVGYLIWRALRGGKKPGPPQRKVARLAQADEDEAASAPVTETVDTSGKPLKEHSRRRAWRDPRLLPKPKPERRNYWERRKREKVMEAEEAGRLFSGTLRTRNRQVRDLLADTEQLARYGLPQWRTEEELAAALGLSVPRLRHYSVHRAMERVRHYVQFAIPKRRGGERLILAPKRELKAIQRQLKVLLVDRLPVSDYAHGFRAGRSIASHAAPHVNKRVVVKLDLKDFFPSLHVGRVRGLLLALGYGYPVAAALAALMTEAERQPVRVGAELFHVPVGSRHAVQGAPTSPGLANSIAMKLDHRLAGAARALGFAYTRYADDLAFSGDDPAQAGKLLKCVQRIVHLEGFTVNPEKTRVMKRGGAQVLTGVTVNAELGLSRRRRRQIRAALHRARQAQADRPLQARVRGLLAFVRMLNKAQAQALGRDQA